MLHLRVFGDFGAMAAVAEQLETLAGVRHVSRTDAGHDGTALVTADVSAETADTALEMLARLSVPAEDIALGRSRPPEPSGASPVLSADTTATTSEK